MPHFIGKILVARLPSCKVHVINSDFIKNMQAASICRGDKVNCMFTAMHFGLEVHINYSFGADGKVN